MKYLNQTDIDVRLQLLNCKFSCLVTEVNRLLLIGDVKCSDKLISDLILLNGYIDTLNCYKIYRNTEFLFSINAFVSYNYYTLYIDGTVITDQLNSTNNIDIINSINSKNITGITASEYEGYVKITANCFSESLKIESYSPTSHTIIKLVNGICSDKNCYTEKEIQKLLDNAAILTNMCFQAINYTYTPY